LQQIETFALWNTLHYINQDNVGKFLVRKSQSAVRPDISSAHNCYFFSHIGSFVGNWKLDYNRIHNYSH